MRIGYAQGELEGDWAVFAKIAGFYVYRVLPEDREDFLHDMMLEMVKVKAKYDARGKPLTEAGLMWVAKYQELTYWAKRIYRLFGLNCTNCTIKQRRECRAEMQFGQCPKGKSRRVLRLNKIIGDGDGDKPTELQDLIAGKSIDVDSRLDAKRILQGLPKKLVKIGYKVYAGIPLEKEEKRYLKHWQEVHTTPLVSGRDHLDERVMELLRKNPQGMTRTGLSKHFRQVKVREIDWYLARLIERQQVIAVKRERSTRGRSPTPLLLMAGATIPEEPNVTAERDERIRQAFKEGWSINRIIRELHHDKRTIRRALNPNEAIPWLSR